MANIHILDTTDGVDFRVVCHIAVPNTPNSAGTNWRTAVINSGFGGTTVLPDGDGTAGTISAAEKASIVNGSLYEVVTTIRVNPTNATNAFMDSEFTRISAEANARFSKALQYFGAQH